LDLLILAFQLLEPFIIGAVIAIEMLMGILAPFMPLLKAIGVVLMTALAAPLQIIVGLFQVFIKLAAQVSGFIGDLTGNKELKQFADDMKAFDKQIGDSFKRINEMQSGWDSPLGYSESVVAGTGKTYDFQPSGSTIVNVTVEGNMDKEAYDAFEDELTRQLQAKGGATID
jgi:hypothetical protein